MNINTKIQRFLSELGRAVEEQEHTSTETATQETIDSLAGVAITKNRGFQYGRFISWFKEHEITEEIIGNLSFNEMFTISAAMCCFQKKPIPEALLQEYIIKNYPEK